MRILSRIFNTWALRTQQREIQSFVNQLAAMDGVEIGLLLAVATHMRNNLEDEGKMLMDPMMSIPIDPSPILILRGMITEYQKVRSMSDAAAAMVWLHTMRVGARHELRGTARMMWRELSRGMPHVAGASMDVYRITGQFPRTHGYEEFPKGLTPDPER